MADISLPALPADDPRNALSEAARRRLWDAQAEADGVSGYSASFGKAEIAMPDVHKSGCYVTDTDALAGRTLK